MSVCQSLCAFTDEYRRTLLLAIKYRDECYLRNHPYRLFADRTVDFSDNRYFKTFDTIRRWLELQHWRISMDDPSWQAYVRFVFDEFQAHKMTPQPAQLKNAMLLKKFLSRPAGSPGTATCRKDRDRLREIYSRVVNNPEMAALLEETLWT